MARHESIIPDFSYETPLKAVQDFTKDENISLLEEAMVQKYPALWALKYKPIKHNPMTFRSKHNPLAHRPWQAEVLNDQHQDKVVMKARQLGMSELATAEMLWFADTHDYKNIMYTFPTLQQMSDFSKTRVSPVIQGSPRLQEKVRRDLNSVTTKAIGTSNIFMRTSGDGSQGEGVDIDMYCADEYDRMAQGAEIAFSESLSSSPNALIRRWSTPTIPGTGIHKQFLNSDQRHYLYKCDKCNKYQEITMDNIEQVDFSINPEVDDIEEGTFQYVCIHCKRPLNRWVEGEWVAKHPSKKEVRGYYISQLNALHITADEIKRKEKYYQFKQLFHNYVIGKPYANEGLKIVDQDIINHINKPKEDYYSTDEYITYVAGIDWGEPSWLIVLGIRSDLSIQVVSMRRFQRSESQPLFDVKQMISHLRLFKPNLIVADAGYGVDKNTELYRAFPHAVYSCTWTTITSPLSTANFIDRWNEQSRMVRVDKTSKMQRMLQAIKNGYIGFYTDKDEMTQLLIKHLKNVQILDQEKGGMVYQTVTRIGDDHLATSLAYALIAVDRITNYGSNVSRNYQMTTVEY